ncbi:type I polyketide synthase [Pseudoduganella namucuonensis]|uniref:Polyketide-type polyunsaturated fatty acid synthase PfaA n=1 Tax=Pseudoduganella namucuonensis TaxID=1035707 RepID=A0A1I7GXN3_9BURK|nr:type I polyketide synthase [Pseudoduganella namucuonensis]SFU53209.1 polyketide-type polyunsaturated fatty acid synthase PfaA [Pseudoduganella namucuonensis]
MSTLLNNTKVIAVTPAHRLTPEIAIAARRANALGVLDLGHGQGEDARRRAIAALRDGADGMDRAGGWGVRWDCPDRGEGAAPDLRELTRLLAERAVPLLVLAGVPAGHLAGACAAARGVAGAVLLEACDIDSAEAAAAAGYDGVILKGHEAGGRVGQCAAFILLQQAAGRLAAPYWIQGGIGPNSAAAAALAGAAGVVLCEQLWLTQEGPYGAGPARQAWQGLDGSETALAGAGTAQYRVSSRSGRARLRRIEAARAAAEPWRALLAEGLAEREDGLLPMGQEIALAAPLARRHGTVGRVVTAIAAGMAEAPGLAAAQAALAPGGPLAAAHGTRYPVAQGPMTRVSDVAPFALAVARGGALPFLALAVLRGPRVAAMLEETRALMGDRPWGVGLLGFMPLALRQEQLEAVRACRPPFAVIAGGRPSQARELEALGVATYLHVPSPGLLRGFLAEGARHFVFEGNECGGHTGPRSSFVLWEQAIEVLLEAGLKDPEAVRVMFAGGVHDALSAAMVAALAAPLVARGMKVGVWMGTAYVFTEEIVAAGAIVPAFQREAVACRETVLLQSGVGVYTRCAATPFCAEFDKTRRELIRAATPERDMLLALEKINIGRLRIAAKGITRGADAGAAERYVGLDAGEQRREGVYMLGDAARLRGDTCTIAALHESVSAGAQALLAGRAAQAAAAPAPAPAAEPIAIVGMACLFPGAQGLREYWENIVRGVDSVREVDPERWDAERMFQPGRGVPDKVYAKWGGFLDDIAFDPQRYGIAPASLAAIEPMQLLALEVARQALADAGLDTRPFPRERTASIFAVGGMADLSSYYNFRTLLPLYLARVEGLDEGERERIVETLNREALPRWTEDAFPGILGNVVAGRVANRLDLGGTNFTVDAACAASLAALDVAIKQLRHGDADVALAGGIDCTNGAIGFMCFAQTHALSPRGRSRPFDHGADGIAISEGVGAVVLKRLADAERDGDRVYALIEGIGSSSDGRNRSLTAPHPAGQMLALRRAYRDAGLEPASVGLVEAHGTGTALGDRSELEALGGVFGGAAPRGIALGSVKSMIGHSKVAAGMAGLIKGALALRHRVLPPTIGVERPARALADDASPFYLNTEARPWLHAAGGRRHCGVSAFGFGGTNFHLVLGEYTGRYREADASSLQPREAEIFCFAAATRAEIIDAAGRLLAALEHAAPGDLARLACALHREQHAARRANGGHPCRLVLTAGGVDELRQRLRRALELLPERAEIRQPPGLYYRESASDAGRVAFLFPGQGSQRVNMLRDLVMGAPALQRWFSDQPAIAGLVYPAPVFDDAGREAQQRALNATEAAQPALGMAGMAAFELLSGFGLAPDFAAGHSYGEYVALCAAGAITPDGLRRLSAARGRLAAGAPAGAMAVLDGDGARVAEAIARLGLGVGIANLNAPRQTIVAGGAEALDAALPPLQAEGMRVRRLPVSAAFHCAVMDGVRAPLAAELEAVAFQPPRVPVYSNTTAEPHPASAEGMRALLARHVAEPVRFVEQIEAMYRDGARVFVECGPGLVLGGLVDAILDQRPHTTLSLDAPGRPGWQQLAQLLAQAMSIGLPVDIGPWFAGRGLDEATLEQVAAEAARRAAPGPLAWRVNGGRALPWHAAPSRPARAAMADAGALADAGGTTGAAAMTDVGAMTDAGATTGAAAGTPAPAQRAASHVPAASGAPVYRLPPRRSASSLPTSHQRRSTMNAEEFTAHEPPSAPHAVQGAPGHAQIAQIQHGLARLLDLQREQQFSLRHFIDFQAQLAGLAYERLPEAPALMAPAGTSGTDGAAWPRAGAPLRDAPLEDGQPAMAPARAAAPPIHLVAAAPSAPEPAAAAPAAAARVATPAPAAPRGATPPIPVLPPLGATPAAAPDGTVKPGAAEFKAELLRAVSERTGYPTDMLDLDADMEADLGIDSIKRIEIFSGLTARYDLIGERDEEAVIGELSGYKTLNQIVDWYALSLEPAAPPEESAPLEETAPKKAPAPSSPQSEAVEPVSAPVPVPAPAPVVAAAEPADPVRRYVVRALEAAARPAPGAELSRAFPVLLAGAESALATALRDALEQRGYTVLQLIPGAASARLDAVRCTADLSQAAGVRAWRALEEARRPFGALVNLMGADQGTDDAHVHDARALFLLLQALQPDLRASATQGAGRVLNLTRLDGRFGLARAGELAAASAGTLGVAKSAAREWPAVRVQCVDAAPDIAPEALAPRLLAELQGAPEAVETGLTAAGRWRLDLRGDDAPREELAALRLAHGAVLLVTGGAYGITADIACALAAEYRPTMVLVGRSAPPGEEGEDTRGVPAEDLRRVLLERMRAARPKVKPAEVDRAVRSVLRERQTRANLAAMRASGSVVEYHALDVRDGPALAALLDDLYLRHGRVDGVLHGAGVVDDKLIGDKTQASFEAVFDTKVLPALLLAERLRPDSLRFIAFFSSVAGRFGNAGQCDYSAANEVLNKLADSLGARWPGVHALSINWGPWDAGMVDDGLRKLYAARAIRPIAPEEGRRHFLREIARGAAGEPELVITSSMRQIAAPRARR